MAEVCDCCNEVREAVKILSSSFSENVSLILCRKGWRKERRERLKEGGDDIGSFTGKRRGFSCLTEEHRKSIAKKGGIAAHQKGTAHVFTPELAKIAGSRGGRSIVENKGRGYFLDLAKKGVEARNRKKKEKENGREENHLGILEGTV